MWVFIDVHIPPYTINRKPTVSRVSADGDPSRLYEYLLVGGLPKAMYRDYKNKSNHIDRRTYISRNVPCLLMLHSVNIYTYILLL